MSGKHPLLHKDLDNFNFFVSFNKLIGSEDQTISFLEEIGLIPSRNSTPPLCCGLPMSVENFAGEKLKWVWRCATKGTKKKGSKSCCKIINPNTNTFFDGNLCRIPLRETLAIVICFVIEMKISDVYDNLQAWRYHDDGSELSWNTVCDYFSYCREIAEVIASHTNFVLGDDGKTVQIDEMFLTKRKYNRGRITEQMTTTVLGLYCKKDNTGLYFKVNSKSKRELWPYINRYVDNNTSRLCTDSAKQYHGIEQLFSSNTVNLQTNNSKEELVNKIDEANTINDLENQNKMLKKSIVCYRAPKLLHQNMALFWYRRNVLMKFKDDGSQIMQFLLDIKQVYPGYVNGELQEGLTLKEIDPPTLSKEDALLLPPAKRPRLDDNVGGEVDDLDIEAAIENDASGSEKNPNDFF